MTVRRPPGGPARARALPRPSRLVVTAALCALALAAAVGAALASSEPRLAGSNDLRLFHTIAIPAGATLCQGPELVPADAARLRFAVSGADRGGPPLAVSVRDGGRALARGGIPGGYGNGAPAVPIGAVPDALLADEVCIANRGDRPVTVHGEAFPPEQAGRLDGAAGDGRARLEWLRAGEESWFELAPTVLHRFGLGKADWLGSWTLVLAAALVLGACAGAIRLVVGEARR